MKLAGQILILAGGAFVAMFWFGLMVRAFNLLSPEHAGTAFCLAMACLYVGVSLIEDTVRWARAWGERK